MHRHAGRRSLLLLLLLCCEACDPSPSRRIDLQPVPATADLPLCVSALDSLPPTWRPTDSALALSQAPWTPEEAADANRAVRKGLGELICFFQEHPAAVPDLWDNAVQCFLDISYPAANMPGVRRQAREQARAVLSELLTPYTERDSSSVTCGEFTSLVTLVGYARQLYPPGDARLARVTRLVDAATAACGSLEEAMGYDYTEVLGAWRVSRDDAFDLVLWSIALVDAGLAPGVRLPAGAGDVAPDVWRFLSRYPLVGARAYADGAWDTDFYDTAYLATHIGYIPTGCGRHRLRLAATPWLYRFLRENFYAVLDMGELDLVAEFVDLLRQYGCSPANDLQVRAGTRFLLGLYHAAGDSWMRHGITANRSPTDAYDLVHKPWCGVLGVLDRTPTPPGAGTYGAAFRQALARGADRGAAVRAEKREEHP